MNPLQREIVHGLLVLPTCCEYPGPSTQKRDRLPLFCEQTCFVSPFLAGTISCYYRNIISGRPAVHQQLDTFEVQQNPAEGKPQHDCIEACKEDGKTILGDPYKASYPGNLIQLNVTTSQRNSKEC